MLKQSIYKKLQFCKHQAITSTSILGNAETMSYFSDVQIAIAFIFMLHMHDSNRVGNTSTMHCPDTMYLLCSFKQVVQVREQDIFLFLQMHFQVFERCTDQFVQLIQLGVSFPMHSSHLCD